ncbi:MAG TPA: extracellular solute-binding protein [Anaerolineae bacterium]|nr:extracellular solute-binding protein [Anaerolineae bacterium]
MAACLLILVLFATACGSTPAPTQVPPQVVASTEVAPAVQEGTSEEAAGFPPPESAKIDWKQFAGTTINALLVTHPYTDAFKAQVLEFEALTGMTVNVTALPYMEAADRIMTDVSSGQGQFDVIFSAYPWDWQFGQFYASLDDYIADPTLTDPEWYDFNDFMPLIIESSRWDRTAGHAIGTGTLVSMPVMFETYILAYRQDLFDKYGVSVPNTWDEFFGAAQALTRTDEGQQLYGYIGRGDYGLGPLMTTLILMYRANGLSDLTEDLVCAIDDPKGVEITEKYLKMVKEASPQGWASVSWDDAMHRFAAGGYAMIHDIDFAAATYENPETSQVAGKVAYAIPPEGPAGRFTSTWIWGLALNAHSKNPKPAWLLIQWATSKKVLLEATLEHNNYNPTRTSVWNDPAVVAVASDWGGGTYRSVVDETFSNYTRLLWTPSSQVTHVADIWTDYLHKAYAGEMTTEAALQTACDEIDSLLIREGIQKP